MIRIDPSQWHPLTYDGVWVNHTNCFGKMWYRCDETYRILETACAKCRPNFHEKQLELQL
jgi:hypothetical protein